MNSHFKYLIQPIPEGEAVTGHELEVQLLKTLDASKGTCLDSLRMLAMLYQMSGHLERSIECIQQRNDLLEDPEELAAGYMSLGQLEETKRDYAAASKHYRRALSLEPCSTETWYFIHNNLGYSLYQLGDGISAIPFLRKAIEIDSNRPNAFKNLGLAVESIGEHEQAAELFISATIVDASDGRSLKHLDELLEAQPILEIDFPDLRKRVEECRKMVEFASQQQPNLAAEWARQRKIQKRKWWQFWKRS